MDKDRPVELPVVMGYTMDERLREFRKIEMDKFPEFIPFDSPKGQRLLRAYFWPD